MPSHNYQWNYGVALSGLTFQMHTNSGTVAIYPNAANLSAVMSVNGGQAVTALGNVVSGVASSRFYSIATIAAANMACYTWCVLVTSNSGSQPTTVHGYNLSGPVRTTDLSGEAEYRTSSYAWFNDMDGEIDYIRDNVSGIVMGSTPVMLRGTYHASAKIDVCQVVNSALLNTTLYTNDTSSIAGQVWNSLTASYTSSTTMGGKSVSVDSSAIADRVWNSLTTTYTSSPTFGGAVMVSGKLSTVSGLDNILTASSGNDKILQAVSGIKNDVSGIPGLYISNSGHALKVDVSALAGIYNAISGFDKILTAVSGVPSAAGIAAGSSVAGIQTADSTSLTSGTLAHDVRMARWMNDNMVIDKTWTPYRQYYWNGTNMSAYFDIADDSNSATKTRKA
jgi:hypothetical protein